MSSHLSEADVRAMLTSGVAEAAIINRLVESGDWSQSGANEIVRFLTRGPDALMTTSLKLPRPKRAGSSSRAGVRRGSWA